LTLSDLDSQICGVNEGKNMQDNNERSSPFGKVACDKINPTAMYRTTTHWYRYDPNRPTSDQLRAAERDSNRRSFREKRKSIGDSIKRNFKRLKLW
jgi:hypothetical protein